MENNCTYINEYYNTKKIRKDTDIRKYPRTIEEAYFPEKDLLNGYTPYEDIYYKYLESIDKGSNMWKLTNNPNEHGQVRFFSELAYLLPECIEIFKNEIENVLYGNQPYTSSGFSISISEVDGDTRKVSH